MLDSDANQKSCLLYTSPTGWAAQLRQIMQRSTQGEVKTKVKRQQLKEDRTKSFLLLAGLTVVLSLEMCIRDRLLSERRHDRSFISALPVL